MMQIPKWKIKLKVHLIKTLCVVKLDNLIFNYYFPFKWAKLCDVKEFFYYKIAHNSILGTKPIISKTGI